MLMRTDPFRELDRLTHALFGTNGTRSQPAIMPMDAYRQDGQFIVHFDLPGVDPSSIDLSVERNVLTVKAERRPGPTGEHVEMQDAGIRAVLSAPIALRAAGHASAPGGSGPMPSARRMSSPERGTPSRTAACSSAISSG